MYVRSYADGYAARVPPARSGTAYAPSRAGPQFCSACMYDRMLMDMLRVFPPPHWLGTAYAPSALPALHPPFAGWLHFYMKPKL